MWTLFSPYKHAHKRKEQVWAGVFFLIHLCQWWGQGNVPPHWGVSGGGGGGFGMQPQNARLSSQTK